MLTSFYPGLCRLLIVRLRLSLFRFSIMLTTGCRNDAYKALGIYTYWIAATGLSLSVMTAGLAYIVEEYCTQSHLSTEDYGRAMQGLQQTRRFKKHTRFVRILPTYIIKATKWLNHRVSGGRMRPERRSLVWTAKTKEHSKTTSPDSENPGTLHREEEDRATLQTGIEDLKSTSQSRVQLKTYQREVSPPSSYASQAVDVEKGRDH